IDKDGKFIIPNPERIPPKFDPSGGGKGTGKGEPPPDPKPVEKQDSPEDSCTATAPAGGPGDPLFYSMSRGPFEMLFLADDRTPALRSGGRQSHFNRGAMFAQMIKKKQTGPLAEAIPAASGHTLAAGLYLPPLSREFERHTPRELAPYAAITAA